MKKFSASQTGLMALIGMVVLAFSAALGYLLPPGIDWTMTFRPAALALVSGGNPYQLEISAPFAGAPWALIPLVPLAFLPEPMGRGILLAGSFLAFTYAAYRLGASRWALIFFCSLRL
ncbi:MAG TPA: hypothetical protein EYP88_03355 [Anaerolineales bacterium]|nr:hypothetical protein [Anaerolineales bacterium]